MEAGTDGCSRPSWGLHLQSSLSAGGVGIRRGSRSCRGEIGRTTWSAPGRRSPRKKTVATNLETRSKFSGTKNLPIILTRSRRPSACVGTVEDQNSCSCCDISPFFYFHHQVQIAGYLCHPNQITSRVCFTSWSVAKGIVRMEVKCDYGVALNFIASPGNSAAPDIG